MLKRLRIDLDLTAIAPCLCLTLQLDDDVISELRAPFSPFLSGSDDEAARAAIVQQIVSWLAAQGGDQIFWVELGRPRALLRTWPWENWLAGPARTLIRRSPRRARTDRLGRRRRVACLLSSRALSQPELEETLANLIAAGKRAEIESLDILVDRAITNNLDIDGRRIVLHRLSTMAHARENLSPGGRFATRVEHTLANHKIDVFLAIGAARLVDGAPLWQGELSDPSGAAIDAAIAPDLLGALLDRLGVRSAFFVPGRRETERRSLLGLADALAEENGIPLGVLPDCRSETFDRAFEMAFAGRIARASELWLIASPKHVRQAGTTFLSVDKTVESQVLEAWKIFEKVPHASADHRALAATAPWLEVGAQLIARADRDLVERGLPQQDPALAAREGSRAAIGFVDRLLAHEAET